MELAIAQGFDDQSRLAAAGHRPGRRRGGVRGAAADGRGLPAVPRARGGRADASRPPARVRARPRDPRAVSRLARAAGRGPPRRRSARPARRAAGRARAGGAHGRVPRSLTRRRWRPASASSGTRWRASLVHPQLVPMLAGVPPEQFDVELHRRVRDASRRRRGRPTRARRRPRRARRPGGRRRRSTRIGAKQALLRLSERGTRARARERTGRLATNDRAPAAARADPRGDQDLG